MITPIHSAAGHLGRGLATIGHRVLDRIGGGALEARLAVWTTAAASVTAAARSAAHPADLRHHGGGLDFYCCGSCGGVSVVAAGRLTCNAAGCESTSPAVGLAAGVRPGVVSDGSLATAPTPGHTSSVPSIAALIDHHRADLPSLVRGTDGAWGLGKVRCRGIGCQWTGRTEADHAGHVAELIDAMQAADRRITNYYKAIRRK